MTKAKLLKIVNPVLFLTALVQMITALTLYFHITVPFQHEIHNNFGMALIVIIIIHFILNWAWVKNTFFTNKSGAKK